MNPEQLQAFRMMRDRINDTQRSVLEPLLQALLNVNQNEEGRRTVIRYIEDLLNNLDRNIVSNFVEVVRGLTPRATAEAMHLLRDGILGEILLINEENQDDDDGTEEELNFINLEARIESDVVELISETSTVETFNVSPFSNVPFNPDHIFDEEKSNA
jgi:hypothetical protein